MFDTSPEEEMVAACRQGDVTRVRELLAYGISPRGHSDGLSFLSIAVMASAEAVVRLLLDEDADAVSNDLGRAMRSGCVPISALILDNLHVRRVDYDFWNDERPLLTDPAFLQTVSLEMVAWMLAAGCDPTERDRNGQDAVLAAERLGLEPAIVALLKKRAKARG